MSLAHILFHTSGFDPIDVNYFRGLITSNSKIEKMCNEFAGTFLVPEESLVSIINTSNFDMVNVENLAKEYSVSPEVILRRLLDKRKISEIRYNNLV